MKGTYNIPNIESGCKAFKTQTASNTAMRGPGLIQVDSLTFSHLVFSRLVSSHLVFSRLIFSALIQIELLIYLSSAPVPSFFQGPF